MKIRNIWFPIGVLIIGIAPAYAETTTSHLTTSIQTTTQAPAKTFIPEPKPSLATPPPSSPPINRATPAPLDVPEDTPDVKFEQKTQEAAPADPSESDGDSPDDEFNNPPIAEEPQLNKPGIAITVIILACMTGAIITSAVKTYRFSKQNSETQTTQSGFNIKHE